MEIIIVSKGFYIEIERASDRFNELALYAPDSGLFPNQFIEKLKELKILEKIFRNIN
jgi:hypothetical protein